MNWRWLLIKWQRFWKRTLPQTLFARSLLILVLPSILTICIGVFVFFDRHWTTTTFRLVDSLAGEVAMIAETWDRDMSPANHVHLIGMAQEKLGLDVRFREDKKMPRGKTPQIMGVSDAMLRSLDNKLDRPFLFTSTSKTSTTGLIITLPVKDGLLDFYLPRKRLFSTTTYVFLLMMIGSGLLLSVIAVAFMRNQIKPVRKLAQVADQFGRGQDIMPFKPTGAKEVRQAAQAFLEMRDRIKRQIKQRTDMLSGVSHDLRTPLTRLKLQLAMLPKNTDTEAMQADIAAMDKMIKAYLDFARDETLEYTLHCNLVDLLQQALNDAAKQGLKVEADLPDMPLMLTVRPQAMHRVFTNILDNMRLYADHGWLSVHKLSRSVEVIFDDQGPGIPAAQREDVFKPFHRLDASRNQDIEGTGLGLTIARDIVQSHGGTITLGDSPQGGLRVTLLLPL
jgi:two-component system osmolarity sensor histidine kinase EnvZ